MEKAKKTPPHPAIQLLRCSAIGAAVGCLCCVLLSLLAALVLTLGDLPHGAILPGSMSIIGLSFLIGGLVAGRILHRRGLLLGACTGAIGLLLLLSAAFFVPDEQIGATLPLKALLTVLPAIIGAVIGVNLRKKY